VTAQQEPTMREEIARALFEHGRPGPDAGIPWDSPIRPEQARDHWREKADAVLAVLERRGDDDAARVRRVRAVHRRIEPPDINAGFCTGCDFGWPCTTIRALDGDDTGSGQ
jgi:hypothetical protein